MAHLRYDIKQNYRTDKWMIIDTQCRDQPTGYEADTRQGALLLAKQMDRTHR